jgi:ABC-type cobalamin/Fe3+-siderophores transport system ATPase subunit
MSSERQLQLGALRNEDRYFIQLKVGTGQDDYRDIDELSGGAQVSILLSMVFETDDTAPLIVDQPEDEMDKAYLFDVLLPALRRFKGRRQVIIATHDANIVVNGDADNVIFLEADYDHGIISEQGAIEEQGVKNAIINTLDGGRDAFNLRQAKYGF